MNKLSSPPLHLLHPPAALLLLLLPPLLQHPAAGLTSQLPSQTLLEGERCPAEEQELPPPVESPVVLLDDHNTPQQLLVLLPVWRTRTGLLSILVSMKIKTDPIEVYDVFIHCLYLAM